jgi:hypothetical protein
MMGNITHIFHNNVYKFIMFMCRAETGISNIEFYIILSSTKK